MNHLSMQTAKTTGRFHPACTFNQDGQLIVSNLSAFWLPELTTQEKICGTMYIVNGSYDGTEPLVRKLERIVSRNLSEDAAHTTEKAAHKEPEMLQKSEDKADDKSDE